MINISVRSKKEIIEELDKLAELKGMDRAQIIRAILERGVKEEKLTVALDLYQRGDSLERAAEITNVSLWDLMDEMNSRGLTKRFDITQEKILVAEALEKEFPELSKKILEI